MSFWTYVAAEFTFDTFYLKEHKEKIDEKFLDDIFGKAVRYKDLSREVWDDIKEHPKNYLPIGSEGTLKKSVWVKQVKTSKGGLSYRGKHVRVYGSLRDFWDQEPIEEWFKRVCNKPEIDEGAVKIELDGGVTPIIITYEQLMNDESDFRKFLMIDPEDKK